MENFENLLTYFDPSEAALLDWLRCRVDCSMLQEIAEADYGADAQEHLAALIKVQQGEPLAVPLNWVPKEVLTLTRWTEPDNLSLRGGSKGIRGHIIRAFACTLLLHAAQQPGNWDYFGSENDIIIPLVESVVILGEEAAQAALRFLAWCVSQVSEINTDKPFYIMAILLLQVFLTQWSNHQMDLIQQLCDWVIQEESKARNSEFICEQSSDWLLGLTIYDQRHELWKTMTRQLLLEPQVPHPSEVSEILRLIGWSVLTG